MRVFITGGTGFIGTFVVRRFQRAGHQVLTLAATRESAQARFGSAKNIRFVYGNLSRVERVKPVLKKFKPEATVHLAWEGIPDYGVAMSVKNLMYGVRLIELLGKLGCRMFVGAGSCWEYGAARGKINERMAPAPSTPFAAAKLSLRFLGERIAAEYGMRFAWARLFYVYGPGQKPTSLIPSLIQSAAQGKIPEIKNPNGANDFIYVGDVADALLKIAEKGLLLSGGAYNIASGRLTRVADIARHVVKQFGIAAPAKQKKKPIGFYADPMKIRKETGWKPRTNIEKGIQETAAFYGYATRKK